jgi:predicted methyltransferase
VHLISGFEAARWLAERKQSANPVAVSFDLGKTRESVEWNEDGVPIPGTAVRIPWSEIEHLARHPHRCATFNDSGTFSTLHIHSPATNRQAGLWAIEDGAPTMMLAGFPMHRTKGITPWADTLAKVAAAAPITGRVLDTTMGLGYTAIAASRTAVKVTTIELDPAVVEIARANPWSSALFDSDKIDVLVGDAFETATTLPSGSFDVVLHDPPTIQLAGDLYSEDFYREIHRLLRPRGRLFHYVGNPESRQGATLTRGVQRRLHHAGFRKVRPDSGSFGVVADR